MRIAIMGSGGMGGFLGIKLAASGHDVIFIARGEHLDAIKSQGIKLLSHEGDQLIYPAKAYENPNDTGPVDLILFCVKLYDTEQAAHACIPMMGDKTFILTLQNGVESVEMISAIVGPNKTLGGAIYVSASIHAPGIIKHSGGNKTIRFAEVDNQVSARTEILESIFKDAGLNGVRAENLQEMLWTKFVLLCANAGLGALTNSGAVSMCSDPESRKIFVNAMWEVYNVANAVGVKLPENTVEDALNLVLSVGDNQDLISSQCLDLRCGKKLELEWIQGILHRLGQKHGVPTPINSTAYMALKRYAGGAKNHQV